MIEEIKETLAKEGIVLDTDEELSEYFNNNFKNVIRFCKTRSIPMVMREKEVNLLTIMGVRMDAQKGVTYSKKIESLDEIVLVHKTLGVPRNDIIAPAMAELIEKEPISAVVDGKEVIKEVEMPTGHNTTHFCMNAEVKNHHSSSWDHCDVVVIQPLTERLYEDVVCLNPADTFFDKEIELSDEIIICKDEKKYQEALRTNPRGSVIYCPVMKPGLGDDMCRAMGNFSFYRFGSGTTDYSDKKPKDMYGEELQKRYPKLITRVDLPDGYLAHACLKINGQALRTVERQKMIMEASDPSRTFDAVVSDLKKDKTSFHITPPYAKTIYEDNETYSWENGFGKNYSREGRLLDNLKTMPSFDAETIFKLITKGIDINNANEQGMLRVKEMVIDFTTKYNNYIQTEYDKIVAGRKAGGFSTDHEAIMQEIYGYKPEKYDDYINNIIMCSEIVNNDKMLSREIDKNVEYDVPLSYYDYTEFLESPNSPQTISIYDDESYEYFKENKDKIKLTVSSPQNKEWVKDFFEQKSKIKGEEETKKFFQNYFAKDGITLDESELDELLYIEECLQDDCSKEAAMGYQAVELLLIKNKRERGKDTSQEPSLSEETIVK